MSSQTCYSDKASKQYGWENCYSACNNFNHNFPAIMSDGRNYASWQPEAVINQRIQRENGISSNWQYRQYMQEHGLQIMKHNASDACREVGLDQHTVVDTTPSSQVPYHFKGVFDQSRPGFGYCNSDLKTPYLSREQLNARMVAPTIYVKNPDNMH